MQALMNHEELDKHIEELKIERKRLQKLRKISEDGLLSLQQRMMEIETELLQNDAVAGLTGYSESSRESD